MSVFVSALSNIFEMLWIKKLNDINTLLKICVSFDMCACCCAARDVIPKIFHFRVEKSLGVSPLWSIKR